ncbi:hypothetical protein L3X38_010916 [Prunus dulcis]|uniref:Uncharacterized protein n=1 Tax=Prunus dulcis TaxID=3755 RepID=A0AAD4WGE0_PRUDU|nr:hypothetical protein L3X38_010916 [Prunus dulcis]
MKFIMGLNDSYATVRSNTLLLEPLPTLNKAYSLVLRHERLVEISNGKTSTQPEAAVFANRESESEERGLWCAKCNKMNHNTKNYCAHLKCTFCGWKDHSFNYCRKRAMILEAEQGSLSKGNQVASYESDTKGTMSNFPFSQKECKQILYMLSKKKSSMANQVGNSSNHEELSGPALWEDNWDGI